MLQKVNGDVEKCLGSLLLSSRTLKGDIESLYTPWCAQELFSRLDGANYLSGSYDV